MMLGEGDGERMKKMKTETTKKIKTCYQRSLWHFIGRNGRRENVKEITNNLKPLVVLRYYYHYQDTRFVSDTQTNETTQP